MNTGVGKIPGASAPGIFFIGGGTMVDLTSFTPAPLSLIVWAARTCKDSFGKCDTDFDGTVETLGPNDEKMIRYCLDNGHDSILEDRKSVV